MLDDLFKVAFTSQRATLALIASVTKKWARFPDMKIAQMAIALMMTLSAGVYSAEAQRRGGPPRTTTVFVETVDFQTFSNRIEALGTLEANERVELTVNVADRVTGIYFDDGERVQAGDTLLSLVQGEQAALVEGAAATVSEARRVVERMAPLVDDGVVSQIQYDEAKRDLEVARSQLTTLRIQQNERILNAPFDGLLGFREASIGTYLSPGDRVSTLVDDSVMKLDFEVPSIFLSKLAQGDEVTATTEDFPGEAFNGQIQSIDNTIDPITRTITVRAILPNEDRRLRAGTFMSVEVLAAPEDRLAIPEQAVQPVGPRSFVFVINESDDALVANRTEITVGRRQEGKVEVVSGLEPGQQVITEGIIRVREGSSVKIGDPESLTPGGRASGANSTGPSQARSSRGG